MNDLITVIITIYNREKYLKQCLDSVKNQTYQNFEVLMVDDDSTDNSVAIAQSYTEDSRFKLFVNEHIGFSAVKNIGLDNASGKYIIFLDSDDFVYPYWLEFLYKAAIETGSDISTCYFDEFIEGKTKSLPEPSYDFYKTHPYIIAEYSFLKMNIIYHRFCSCFLWNKLVKKEIYDTIRFKDQMALSDVSEIHKIVDKANKVIQIQTPLIHYRRHSESTGGDCHRKGLPYEVFRAQVLEDSAKFVWEHYPQSRYAVQLMLVKEINLSIQRVGKENFLQFVERPFFREVFKERPMPYLYPDTPVNIKENKK